MSTSRYYSRTATKETQKSVRVLNWNIACLPKPWNSFGSGDPTDRQAGILQYIVRLDPDIVCLQEVFDTEVTDYLLSGFNAYGYNAITSDQFGCCAPGCLKSLGIGFRGGLLVAFRQTFKKEAGKFYKYSAGTGEDKFANKGVLHVRIDTHIPSIGVVDIFNTHMQANATRCCPGNLVKTRLSQLEQLKEWAFTKQDGGTVIVAGDFNIASLSNEYSVLETAMQNLFIRPPLPADVSASSTRWGKRVDYIFYFPKSNWGQVENSYSEIKATEWSDHYVLLDDYSPSTL